MTRWPPEDEQRGDGLHDAGEAADDEAEFDVLERRADVAREEFFPFVVELGLDGEGFDGLDAGDGFDHEGVVRCAGAPDGLDLPLDDGDGPDVLYDVEGYDNEGDEGERYAVPEHERDEDDREKDVKDGHEGLSCEEFADAIERADAHEGVADAAGFVVRERQADEVVEEPRAEDGVELDGRVVQQVGAQPREEGLQQEEDDHADADDGEGGPALVADDFVDDDLRDERHADAHELQEEGGEHDFAEVFLVVADDTQEPVEVVFLLEIGPAVACGEDEDFAGPGVGELLLCERDGLLEPRVDEVDGFVVVDDDDDVGAALHLGDGGHGDLAQFVEGRVEELAPQVVVARRLPEVVPEEGLVGALVLLDEFRLVEPRAEVREDLGQADHACRYAGSCLLACGHGWLFSYFPGTAARGSGLPYFAGRPQAEAPHRSSRGRMKKSRRPAIHITHFIIADTRRDFNREYNICQKVKEALDPPPG